MPITKTIDGSLDNNYRLLASAVVERAVLDYERGYKTLKLKYGQKENFPSETEVWLGITKGKSEAGKNPENAHGNIMRNFLTAKSFLLSDRLKIYTAIDGKKIISHVESLIDSGSSLKDQQKRAAKYFARADWARKKYTMDYYDEEDSA